MSAHQQLRAATREAHERLDRLFSALNLSDASDYADFLTAHAAAFLPVENALAAAGADQLLPGWQGIRRADALANDLAELALEIPPAEPTPEYSTVAEVLGGLYVIEGSRLGGKLLQRDLTPGVPARFLRSIAPAGHWRGFVATLDKLLYANADRQDAAKSAVRTFECFEYAGRRVLNK